MGRQVSAQSRGWGPPGCTSSQLVRIVVPGMLDSAPYFPMRVRREVAPLFREMLLWLASERQRLGLPPLSSSGGYNKRPKRPPATGWSNHSWGLAGDVNAGANPMQRTLRTDMPPGTSAKARSLGLSWGGDWTGTKDPMHFEFIGTPADAARRVAELRATQARPAPELPEEDDVSPQQAEDIAQRAGQVAAERVIAALHPKGGEPLGAEVDKLRQDMRQVASKLGFEAKS